MVWMEGGETERKRVENGMEQKKDGRRMELERRSGERMERGTGRNAERNAERSRGRSVYMDHRFIRVIGEGAFSRVYLVEDEIGQRYACKVSRDTKLLRREAEILGRLYHPLFPAYMGYEEREGAGRLFMEYISGRSLGQLVRLRRGFSARQAMRIAEELADGLKYLHERQPAILYRDLKPENIMVCENGRIKVIDFGCACYQDTQGGEMVGTPGFAPPEQLSVGVAAGIYSDVYGLGKTIQSMMAEKEMDRSEKNRSERVKCYGRKRKHTLAERRGNIEESRCRYQLDRMIEESTREDFRQRPQDMISVSNVLTGKRKKEDGIICEKNIWESSYKNSCSLSLI